VKGSGSNGRKNLCNRACRRTDIKGCRWNNKLGWVAQRSGAKFVLTLKKLKRLVRFMTIINMRSYGDKWGGAR